MNHQVYNNKGINHTQNVLSYPFVFTGKGRDSLRLYPQNEGFCGARLSSPLDLLTSFSYFGARYYDPDLTGLFLSVDPMSDKYPFLSPYAYSAWNPVKLVDPDGRDISEHIDIKGYIIAHYNDGDNSIYLHKEGITKERIDVQRCIQGNTGGSGIRIGCLGGNVDMNDFFMNKLEESGLIANTISKMNYGNKLFEYAKKTRTYGNWDLKNNTKTIWGVAWQYDSQHGTKTLFHCDFLRDASAADVGNFHAGYTGIKAGISKYVLCKGAGAAEGIKAIRNKKILEGLFRLNLFTAPLNIRSGDRIRDYQFNTSGMQFAEDG